MNVYLKWFCWCVLIVGVTTIRALYDLTIAELGVIRKHDEVVESDPQSLIPIDLTPPSNHDHHPWTWTCVKTRCEKQLIKNDYQSLLTCQNLCGDSAQLWPKPQNISLKKSISAFVPEQLIFTTNSIGTSRRMLEENFSIFYSKVTLIQNSSDSGLNRSDVNSVVIKITLKKQEETKLTLKTSEKYVLRNRKVSGALLIDIKADTFFGARHGLETLYQLIWWNDSDNYRMLTVFDDVLIEDGPMFRYRGLMVDTARNFYPIENLKRTIDGMAASKLNVFHIHAVDRQSFPLVLPQVLNLSKYGAYSPDMVYTPEGIQDLVRYGNIRGVRVILEVDAPSHVRNGWEWGPEAGLGDLISCINQFDSTTGQFNVDNPNVFKVLEKIYSDLLGYNGQDEIFHLGGDEVDTSCWQMSQEISFYNDVYHLWGEYIKNMTETLKKANSGNLPENIVIWSSLLTLSPYLEKYIDKNQIVIQSWLGDPGNLVQSGYRTIISTVGHWYLDCGFGNWREDTESACSPITTWQNFYTYQPWKTYSKIDLVLGAEACLWSELVDEDTLDTRIWPRAAAFAERLWSDPEQMSYIDLEVYSRLSTHRQRLKSLGLKVSAFWPQSCTQNPKECYMYR